MLESMVDRARREGRGPFRVDQLHDGDRYELSEGHALYCYPGGHEHGRTRAILSGILGTDPDVEEAGADVGHQLTDDTLRAPDVSVGNVPPGPGWAQGAPALAVEIAGSGQDEADLAKKIEELLEHGARFIWVIRLTGPRRVEVHQPGRPFVTLVPGDLLEAPGVLRNPVPVEALFDAGVADRVALRNLLQRHGYESLEAVREEAKVEGRAEGRVEGRVEILRRLVVARFGAVPDALEAKLRRATEAELDELADRVVTAPAAEDLLGE
jgi:Uma2 family endonuclease